jgi:50S ribosomal protein L16 3-hydroxylase
MNEILCTARGTQRFLREFWQKEPLFVTAALPQLAADMDRAHLIALACRDDVESRLAVGAGKNWHVEHGPFRRRDFARLPPRNWTLLVNGVESFVPAGRTLQKYFGFVPYARQDDVMVSYAAPGGNVGPHFDSYDVFLLQGTGERRWQIGDQRDLTLLDGAPLKILRRFVPRREWTARTGDVLYLPPKYAHHGVAVDECITWSIGFRAPGRGEMAARFLDYLQDNLQLDGGYHDPELAPQRHRAAISDAMLNKVRAMVDAIQWSKADVARCLGEYLTEPRANVVFKQERAVTPPLFFRAAERRGLRLALKSRMLYRGNLVFINGETVAAGADTRRLFRKLADERALPPPVRADAPVRTLLYAWYRAGYIELDD